MRNFDTNNAFQELKNLKQNQYITLKVDSSISKELEDLAYKKASIEELLKVCLLDDQIDEDKVTDIIKHYTMANSLIEKIMCSLLLDTLGEKAFIYLRDPMEKINYYFNFILESIVISKH